VNVLRGFRGVDDAWGRPSNQLNVYLNVPVGPPPPEAGPSRTNLEMTLVDNHRGVVLWHTRQVFPASPARAGDVRDVIASLLSGLPMSQ
jgi:hypothetical protein